MENIKEREDLVKKVKEKILDEIKIVQKHIFQEIVRQCSDIYGSPFIDNFDEDENSAFNIVNRCAYDLTALAALKMYIEDEDTFLDAYGIGKYCARYKITEEELNIMLDDNFNVVYKFLDYTYYEKLYNFDTYLSDIHFAKKTISVCDYLIYKQHKEDSQCQ